MCPLNTPRYDPEMQKESEREGQVSLRSKFFDLVPRCVREVSGIQRVSERYWRVVVSGVLQL